MYYAIFTGCARIPPFIIAVAVSEEIKAVIKRIIGAVDDVDIYTDLIEPVPPEVSNIKDTHELTYVLNVDQYRKLVKSRFDERCVGCQNRIHIFKTDSPTFAEFHHIHSKI